ncbi:MAG: hypothetical protein RSB59_04220 [Clostridia bacterium]
MYIYIDNSIKACKYIRNFTLATSGCIFLKGSDILAEIENFWR